MTTITITKDIKKSGNYNSIGAGISITTEVPDGELESKVAEKLYEVANFTLKKEMDNLPVDQQELITPKRTLPDTEGYR